MRSNRADVSALRAADMHATARSASESLPLAGSHVDLGPHARLARRSLNGTHPGDLGTMLPPFIDHHVHTQLIDAVGAPAGGLAGLVDLGGEPAVVAAAAAERGLPRLRFAGAFLTAVGGYPAGRSWCPPGAVRELAPVAARAAASDAAELKPAIDATGSGPAAAPAPASHQALPSQIAAAVDEQFRFGATVVKVALNADAGPVLDRAMLDAVITAARSRGLPVAGHAEGDGMAELAIASGVDALVHTPWTSRLPDDVVAAAASAGQVWISTLAIHREQPRSLERAIDNLARFRAAGGRVVYGTDLGNGDLPVAVNADELTALVRAGLAASDLVGALTDPWPSTIDWPAVGVATFVRGAVPATLDAVPAWLASAVVLPIEELELLQ